MDRLLEEPLMAKKTFAIDITNGTVTPGLQRISMRAGDQIEWIVNDGDALVVFDPTNSTPVSFTYGPAFDHVHPALGTGTIRGVHPHTISCWYTAASGRKNISVTAILIVDP
jgi:hypothetical protein